MGRSISCGGFLSCGYSCRYQNTGFARGNNLAIGATSVESEWIALINPDAFAELRWLEALLVAAESSPGFDVFGSKLVNANAVDPTLLDGRGRRASR
jgi:GT2 family glycosyltransferase